MYKREGVYEGTYRPAFVDVKIGDQIYADCLTFLVLQKSDEIAPPGHYRSEIEKGADLYLSEAFRKKNSLAYGFVNQTVVKCMVSEIKGV
ncbi:hypothetical protein BsIDN1_25970 [Bacillus safensis]|uniref:Uncharacterized protein n=1 Tax=Bacillus safensis TaxID=561879 RepID=A0A5S9MAJ2_BACIA|nr:hypothetical protein BsIDN1_25970 [Bacillus safensis]